MHFLSDRYKEGNPTFLCWLIAQKHRDDLIGDIANDVESDFIHDRIKADATFEEIYQQVKKIINPSDWNINHPKETGLESFERIGRKPHDNWSPKVSPLLCLKLAWDEYE